MEDSEAYDECIVKVEREVKQRGGNGDRLAGKPVEVTIGRVKEERDSEEEISPPVQVIVETVKQETLSDEEELEPPAKVTVEDFKEDVSEGYYASVLPAGSTVQSSVSLRPQTSLQLQWKDQDGQPVLPAHISNNVQNWVDNKGCMTIAAPNAGSTWISTDAQNFSEGTLVKDGNVQYVLMTSADSFYVVENAENNAACASDGSIKNLISGNKNIQLISIVPNQCTTSGGNVVIGSVGEEQGSVSEPERDEGSVIATSSSSKRSAELVSTFSTDDQIEICDIQPQQIIKKKKKVENQDVVVVEEENDSVKEGCDVDSCAMRCSTMFNDDERQGIYRLFHSLPAEEQKKFVLQNCTRKIFLKDVKALDGSTRTTTHFNYEFQLKSTKDVPVQVCRLFFATTLGFNDFYFNCYLTDLFKNGKNSTVFSVVKNSSSVCSVVTRCTCPNVHQRSRGRSSSVKLLGSCKLHSDVYCHSHKELFHNHIESFLRTLCVPQGELVRTIRYLPKDVSIEMMHQDFCRKHPEINSSYELYRSFVIHFTS